MSAAAPSNVARYTPGRPATDRDIALTLNGKMTYLGVLVSTGAAVNNATTATPFNNEESPTTVTLKGKLLLLQPTAAGHVLTSSSASISVPTVTTVATFATVPPAANTAPGVKLQAEERAEFYMLPSEGFLQWIPTSGSANCFVWELT